MGKTQLRIVSQVKIIVELLLSILFAEIYLRHSVVACFVFLASVFCGN